MNSGPAIEQPVRRAKVWLAVVEGLVDHVPRRDLAAVVRDDRADMRLHTLEHQLARGWLVSVEEYPGGCPLVLGPDQRVADDLKFILQREGDQGIGLLEVEFAFPRLDCSHFHAILGSDAAELLEDQLPLGGSVIVRHPSAERDPDDEPRAELRLQ